MRRVTRAELAGCDGRAGRPAYVAYDGVVYDVSGSFLWHGGRHQASVDAGRDLTAELVRAPHGAELLGRLPRVGVLVDDVV